MNHYISCDPVNPVFKGKSPYFHTVLNMNIEDIYPKCRSILEADSWTGYKDDNVDITFDENVRFKGSIYIHGFWGEDTIIDFKGENRICKKIINFCDIEGTFSYYGEEIDVGKPSRLEVRMYYSKGIGWLAMKNYFLTPYMPWVDNPSKGYTCKVTDYFILK